MEISQKIVDYAIWYYLKYFPSKKALEKKLKEKFGPTSKKGQIYGGISDEEVKYITEEKLRNIILEEEAARSKIKNYVAKNKNFSYIIQKMSEKKFEKDLVLEILRQDFDYENETLLNKEKLQKQILALKNKGKSRNYIKNKFLERRQDREIIESILDEVFDEQDEFESLKIEYKKLETKNLDRQKIIQRLMYKGFCYDDIKKII